MVTTPLIVMGYNKKSLAAIAGCTSGIMIAVEILQAIAGSFGILFAMPLTALFCSLIYLKDKSNNR